MGSFAGHAIPGSFFICIGVWWWINVLWIYAKSLRENGKSLGSTSFKLKSTTWFAVPLKRLREIPIEPMLKIVFAVLGIFLELSRTDRWIVVGKNGDFVNLNNFAHLSMYSAFLIWATVEVLQFYKVLELPSCSEHVLGSIALFVEGFLFYSHLDGRPKLDRHLHILLYVVIFGSAVVLLLEAWMKSSFLLLVARMYLVLLQGTWFFQIAHSLHGTKPWKNNDLNQAFVAIAFTLHAIVVLSLVIVSFIIVSCKVRGCRFRGSKHLDIEAQNNGEDGESVRTSLMDEDHTLERY